MVWFWGNRPQSLFSYHSKFGNNIFMLVLSSSRGEQVAGCCAGCLLAYFVGSRFTSSLAFSAREGLRPLIVVLAVEMLIEPRHEKTCLRGLRPW